MTRGSVRALSNMGHPTGDLNSEYVLSGLYRHQPDVRVFIALGKTPQTVSLTKLSLVFNSRRA